MSQTPPIPATPIKYALTPLGLRTVPVLRGKRLRPGTSAHAARIREGESRKDTVLRVEAELREGVGK